MINLFINTYTDKNQDRQKELDHCFKKNKQNPFISSIILLDGRPTFREFFNEINRHTKDDNINIIANSDIYFDDTIELAKRMNENECFALCRWDILEDGTERFFNRSDSQDVWIFKGKIKDVENCDFPLGRCGCDNAIANRIQVAGYVVRNPSRTIKSYHLHNSGIRNYDPKIRNINTVAPIPYLILPPTTL